VITTISLGYTEPGIFLYVASASIEYALLC